MDGTLNAIVAADTSSDVATYVNASLGSALTYASSVASAFGTFQIGTRQARYNATASTNPRKAFYGQEVTRATNMKSLRDQYYSVAGEAISDYYASITSAYTDYVSGALTAWKTNSAASSTWSGYVDSIYAIAETEDLADAAAYRTAVEADATAQLAADNASVAAYCSYLRSETTAQLTTDQGAAVNAKATATLELVNIANHWRQSRLNMRQMACLLIF